MTAPSNDLNDQHWALFERLDAGENAPIPPLMRRKLRRMGLIVATDPPRAIRTTPGRQSAPPPRQHALTDAGRARLVEHRRVIAEQGRHDVAASVARHADLLDPRPMTPAEVADMVQRCHATTQQPQVRAARSRWHVPRALTAEQVVALRTERASGESLVALAARYGVSTVTVHRIAIGERYQDAGGPLAQVRARRSA